MTAKKECVVTLRDQKFKVQFPNVGQYIDIETSKQSLTNGRYAIMAWSALGSAQKALDLVDSIAYLGTLIGKPLLDLYGVKTDADLLGMPMEFGEEMIVAYRDQYSPFHNAIEKRDDRDTDATKSEADSK